MLNAEMRLYPVPDARGSSGSAAMDASGCPERADAERSRTQHATCPLKATAVDCRPDDLQGAAPRCVFSGMLQKLGLKPETRCSVQIPGSRGRTRGHVCAP
eukprot:Amastigsp_a845114_107.p4 type:complete len:101 gc:universal Amastigsp_a845114_107:165-467(+)